MNMSVQMSPILHEFLVQLRMLAILLRNISHLNLSNKNTPSLKIHTEIDSERKRRHIESVSHKRPSDESKMLDEKKNGKQNATNRMSSEKLPF